MRLLAVILGLLVACSAETEPELPEVAIAPCFGTYTAGKDVPVELIQQAMEEANEFLCAEAFQLTSNGNCKIVEEHSGWPGGQWRPDRKEIGLTFDGLDTLTQKNIIMHELLHSVWFQHVAEGDSIMSPFVGPESSFSDLDVIECKNRGLCVCH